ncbi:MAG: sugar-binding transcriptional regulator, partial [Ruminococcaceae bacterium]|nr:sugar-binding transcriptional regulator [Oscillospiraceae bacterium]
IACGKEKAEAIAGALQTKMIDTLITDEYTARRVLEYC